MNSDFITFCVFIKFCVAQGGTQIVIKNNAKCNAFLSTCYMLVVWSETFENDLEMFPIPN